MKELKMGYVEPTKKLHIIKVKDSLATKSTFTKHFAESLGDIEVDDTSYHTLLELIKSKKIYDIESILYLLDFIKQFPTITEDGLDKITSLYIKEIFKDEKIIEEIREMKEKGIDELSFSKLLLEVEKRYIPYIKCLKCDLAEVDSLLSTYPTRYVTDIKDYMKAQKVLLDKIVPYIPSKELVEQDIKHQLELARYYRIDFGMGALGTVSALKAAIQEGVVIDKTTFDKMKWSYHIHFDSFDKEIPLSFTKEEYIASVQKESLYKRYAEMILLTYMVYISEKKDDSHDKTLTYTK